MTQKRRSVPAMQERDCELRSVDVEKRTAEFVASTETRDSHGTILKSDWRLERYRKNPVVLFDHNASEPIGTARTSMDGNDLIAKVTFAKNDARADWALNLVEQGVLRGMSVRFRAGKVRYEKDGDVETPVLSNNELYELSIVSQPSNPDALARSANLTGDELVEEDDMGQEDKTPPAAPAESVRADVVNRSDHEAAIRALTASNTATEARAVAAEARATALEEKFKKLDAERMERKLESLSGVKFPPAAKETWRTLLNQNEATFDAMVVLMPDIVGARLVPEKANEERSTDVATVDEEDAKYRKLVDENIARGMSPNEANEKAALAVMKARGLSTFFSY